MSGTNPPDAAKITGLLADDSRRKVVAALVLGAATVDEVAEATGLETRVVHDAAARLVSGGLVVGHDGALVLVADSFGEAARSAAPQLAPPADETERVMRAFMVDGRMTSIPSSNAKRRLLLDRIAQDFEPGLRYSEDEVNLIVGRWYDDHVTIRRYLIDEELLSREDGVYWRSGGAVLDV